VTYQILNGDALFERFKEAELEGRVIICREALIDGMLPSNTLEEFWHARANYLATSYGGSKNEYAYKVKLEFEKIINAPNNSEFNLWFGYDLFCQVNMWFIISLLTDNGITNDVYVVYPSYLKGKEIWNDFGQATAKDLNYCFNNKIKFGKKDLELGRDLWIAYKNNDFTTLETLAESQSPCFPYLKEVCKAHIDRYIFIDGKNRPELVIEDIVEKTSSDFHTVFGEFFKREGIYGFGDLQVKKMYDKIVKDR
jgi:hypothetical protein